MEIENCFNHSYNTNSFQEDQPEENTERINSSRFLILIEINRIISQSFEENATLSDEDLAFIMKFKQYFKFNEKNILLNIVEEKIVELLEQRERKQQKRIMTSPPPENYHPLPYLI